MRSRSEACVRAAGGQRPRSVVVAARTPTDADRDVDTVAQRVGARSDTRFDISKLFRYLTSMS